MSKIIIADLIRMMEEGLQQKDIAASFGVSEAAVSKAVSKVKRNATRPEILDQLTDKELKFASEIAAGASQSHAASVAFNVSSKDSAKSLGCTLMKSPAIQEAVSEIMNDIGLGKRFLVKRLKDHVIAPDPQASLRAVDMGLKLHDAYPAAKSMTLNLNSDVSPLDLSKYV